MKKRLSLLLPVLLVIIVMLTDCSARSGATSLLPLDATCQCSSPATMTETDNTDNKILDIIQKAQIGIPVEGRHMVEQHTTSAQQHFNQRWNKRMQRMLCVSCTRHLDHQYKLTLLTYQHLFTLRHSNGDDIYGRCQMRC